MPPASAKLSYLNTALSLHLTQPDVLWPHSLNPPEGSQSSEFQLDFQEWKFSAKQKYFTLIHRMEKRTSELLQLENGVAEVAQSDLARKQLLWTKLRQPKMRGLRPPGGCGPCQTRSESKGPSSGLPPALHNQNVLCNLYNTPSSS